MASWERGESGPGLPHGALSTVGVLCCVVHALYAVPCCASFCCYGVSRCHVPVLRCRILLRHVMPLCRAMVC